MVWRQTSVGISGNGAFWGEAMAALLTSTSNCPNSRTAAAISAPHCASWLTSADPTEPVDIRYDRARQRLEISWADGAETAYSYEFLRWRCPCATCAGEMGVPGQLQFVKELRPEQYQLESIQLVGLYAVRPTW